MPRKPRKYYDTSFFHVIVQGINKEFIFCQKRFIRMYLKELNTYKENTNIEILAYCIMSNHAHILLHSKSIEEMSKFMQKVNTQYAKYYNYMKKRVGYVFRDRFVSENIKDEKYLINCINYIHKNPVKAKIVEKCEHYKFSSYNTYLYGDGVRKLEKILNVKLNKDDFIADYGDYVFKDIECNINECIDIQILEFLNISNILKDEAINDRVILKMLVRYLKDVCNVKYTDMMKYFNITKGQMEILKKR